MKWKNRLERIPRPVRACVYTVLAIVLVVVCYIALGSPTLSVQQEFRRAEKANLIGPSKIVDTLDSQYHDFDKMIVGETDYGICFFGRYYTNHPYNDPFAEKHYLFTYVEKTGDLTVTAAPNFWGWAWVTSPRTVSLPVYLFTDEPEAVRAEIEMVITGDTSLSTGGNINMVQFSETFRAEAARTQSGIFRFWFEAKEESGLSALRYLSNVTGGSFYFKTEGEYNAVIPATVRLYDSQGKLILERTIEITGY